MSDQGQPVTAPHFVVSSEGEIFGEDSPQNREIVRRIHACVNACDGLSTDELENGIIQDMQRVIADIAPLLKDRVENQRQAQSGPTIVIDENPAA